MSLAKENTVGNLGDFRKPIALDSFIWRSEAAETPRVAMSQAGVGGMRLMSNGNKVSP